MPEIDISKPMLPQGAPPLAFGLDEQVQAWEMYRANCGPGAIAAITGRSPLEIAPMLGDKLRRIGGTTEVMLRKALTELDVEWVETDPGIPSYGICRIQWDGPWITHPDPYKKLAHSHWVGMAGGGTFDEPFVFDINAIGIGGWMPFDHWRDYLRPWLLSREEPQATGRWWISETLEIPLPQPGIPTTPEAS